MWACWCRQSEATSSRRPPRHKSRSLVEISRLLSESLSSPVSGSSHGTMQWFLYKSSSCRLDKGNIGLKIATWHLCRHVAGGSKRARKVFVRNGELKSGSPSSQLLLKCRQFTANVDSCHLTWRVGPHCPPTSTRRSIVLTYTQCFFVKS